MISKHFLTLNRIIIIENNNPNPSTLLTTATTLRVQLYIGCVQSINKTTVVCLQYATILSNAIAYPCPCHFSNSKYMTSTNLSTEA